MKINVRILSAVLPVLAFLVACAPEADDDAVGQDTVPAAADSPAVQQDRAGAEEAIAEQNRLWIEAVEAGDADFIADLHTEDGRLMAPNAPAAEGREAVRSAWEEILAMPGLSLSFEATEIVVSDDGSMAYDVGTYDLSFEDPEAPGGQVEDEGKYLVVWENVDGEWKVAADMFNSDMPMDMEQ